MVRIALHGTSIQSTTAKNHINVEKYILTGEEPIKDNAGNIIGSKPIYDWKGGYTDNATVTGTASSSVTNVKINGAYPILSGDSTSESDDFTDTVTVRYKSGKHTNGVGTVKGGNSSNVKINGKLVSVVGATVSTHSGDTSSLLSTKSSTTVSIG